MNTPKIPTPNQGNESALAAGIDIEAKFKTRSTSLPPETNAALELTRKPTPKTAIKSNIARSDLRLDRAVHAILSEGVMKLRLDLKADSISLLYLRCESQETRWGL
jgi:hypothetical protein